MSNTAEAKAEKMLERVRALLALAEHPNTPVEEADTALSQANRLMAKYAIEEATLRASQSTAERRHIERKSIKLNEGNYFEFTINLRDIMSGIARANRLQAVMLGFTEIELFGMHADIVWAEQLYTQIYFDFISKLAPKWDLSATYDSNVYRFKNAGYKWAEINKIAIAAGAPDMENKKAEKVYRYAPVKGESYTEEILVGTGYFHKMHGAYKREVKRLGDTDVVASSNPSQYRRDFADGFTNRIRRRLFEMSQDAKDEVVGSGAELVLSELSDEIREEMYAAHPTMRPMTQEELRARQEAERKARNDMLDAMTEKQRYNFLEKERRQKERDEKSNRAYWAKQDAKRDWAGHTAGQRAANTVQLNRNAGATKASGNAGELA